MLEVCRSRTPQPMDAIPLLVAAGLVMQDTTFSRPTTLFLPAVVDRRGYRLLDLFLVERTIARLCSNDKGSSLPNAIGTA